MPPKKGKKKSKAELEAERLEAEEQRRREEEAEAKRLEAERVKREAEEKKLREEQATFRTEEVARLEAETANFQVELTRAQEALAREEADKAAKLEWEKYTACDPTPDASCEAELNTYISITREEKPTDLGEAFSQCNFTEVVAREVICVMAAAQARKDATAQRNCAEFLHNLRRTSNQKLDSASLYIIHHSDEFVEQDQVLLGEQRGDFRFGMWVNLHPKQFRGTFKLVPFGDVGLQVDIPRQLNQTVLAIRTLFFPYDNLSCLCAEPPTDVVLGGVMQLDLFELPPSPKTIKPKWILRPANEEQQGLQLADTPYSSTEAAFGGLASLRISFTLPEFVFQRPDGNPKVVIWDDKAKEWSTDHVDQTSTEFDVSSRLLRFQSTRTGLFALVHSRVAQFPFKEWRLEPALEVKSDFAEAGAAAAAIGGDGLGENPFEDEDCVHLTILTRLVEVKIQITSSGCKLLTPELPGLHMVEQEPGQLLHELLRVGLNIMPIDSDATEMDRYYGQLDAEPNIVPKSAALEARLAEDVSSMAASFDFYFSRWNNGLGKDRCTFRTRETSVFTGGNTETFDLDMVLMEEDTASASHKNASHIGVLSGSGIKCSLVRQTEEPSHDFMEAKKAVAEANAEAQKAAVEAAMAAAEGDEIPAEPELLSDPVETFDDRTVPGEESHVYLQTAQETAAGLYSEEAHERVRRASPTLRKLVKQMLVMTRPFSFTA